MKQKPEISYDRETNSFQQDGKQITVDQARERWDAIDSDWTQGAFRIMNDLIHEEAKRFYLGKLTVRFGRKIGRIVARRQVRLTIRSQMLYPVELRARVTCSCRLLS